jgi:hypothetical protein
MSVTRYRDISEMPSPTRGDPKDPATYRRIRELWQFTHATLPALFRPGVYRYASIEESERARDDATIVRMRTLRVSRKAGT